ncbi:universal stress protein [Zobellia uliginosa]|uniref:universal stress protein n=1 Tax=Zobellia uliginosa TaxID=143224 RepID=UPI001C06FB66|nr:universal stress protein [Zobellia uliginosa]MBU2948041.1 universal stress protein [Zobellia uliginosa]
MKKNPTILIPYNFSKTAKKALDYAVNYVGQDRDLKIILGYVSVNQEMDTLEEAFKGVEEEYASILKNKIEWIAIKGTLTESLMKIQKDEQVDLIIMGTFGAFDNEDSSPTNTSKLVLEIDCPVLVVPFVTDKIEIKNIGLVLGKEEIEDKSVLDTLLKVVRRFNAKVYVITIENSEGVYGYSSTEEKNESSLEYYLEDFYSEHVFIANSDVVEGVLEYASKKELDMIAILPRNHATKSEPSKGALTEMLTLHSQIPVLAID